LRQKENHNNNGMDMSIICLRRLSSDETHVTFAGAKHTMYYTDVEKKGEIFELKGTRKAIGGIQNDNTVFENHTLTLKKGSWIYTGTDGLPDQNNAKRKRFGEKRIKEIILQHNHESAKAQKIMLEQALHTHMEETEQRDDILWIGFQL
jgi:serine phosphatase RsbU (regulator of sigma subunit)